ncbi:MAG: S41 family peptidase [Pseudomonadota bacterium]
MRKTMMAALALSLSAAGMAAAAPRAPAMQAVADETIAIAAVRAAIAANYVVRDKRAALDAVLARGLAAGRYKGLDPQELSRRVTDDLFAVAHDKHLSLSFQPQVSAQLAQGGRNDEIDDSSFFKAFARSRNHGVAEMRVLEGNIRIVSYEGFIWTGPESAAAIDAAMAFLRDGDAAIIDLRHNGGGSPEAVRHLASYFVPADTRLVTFHLRSDAPTTSVSEATVPGGRIGKVPVYVLTSGHTASAAEEFASHVRRLGFGTLVGEATAGAAYRNEQFPVPGGFVLSVSIGYPELPGGGNWEGTGVAPAIAVPEGLALERALQAAALALAEKAAGPEKTALLWSAALHGARVAPAKVRLPLASYAGRYGPRVVSVEGDHLVYQRDGGLRSILFAVGPDLFALERDSATRVRFTGAGDAVTGFDLERADGSVTPQPRS